MKQNPYSPPSAVLERLPEKCNVLLHKLSGIGVATFFGGAFAAAYLVYSNYKQLGQPRKARQSLVLFCLGGLFFFYVAWHTPPDVLSMLLSVGVPQTIFVLVVAQYTQGLAISAHRLSGCAFRSNWFAFLIGIVTNAAFQLVAYGVLTLSA